MAEQPDRILGYFLEEANGHLDTIEQGLLKLPETVKNPAAIKELFRAAHSIKGSAAMLGLKDVRQVGHHFEAAFKILKEREVTVDTKLQSLLLQGFGLLRSSIGALDGSVNAGNSDIYNYQPGEDPVFEELQSHLSALIQQDESNAATFYPTTTGNNRDNTLTQDPAIAQVFGDYVTRKVGEINDLCGGIDLPETRTQIQQICQKLGSLGENFEFLEWTNLLAACRLAIANPHNSLRQLDESITKAVKQAQILILADRHQAIGVTPDLEALIDCSQLRANGNLGAIDADRLNDFSNNAVERQELDVDDWQSTEVAANPSISEVYQPLEALNLKASDPLSEMIPTPDASFDSASLGFMNLMGDETPTEGTWMQAEDESDFAPTTDSMSLDDFADSIFEPVANYDRETRIASSAEILDSAATVDGEETFYNPDLEVDDGNFPNFWESDMFGAESEERPIFAIDDDEPLQPNHHLLQDSDLPAPEFALDQPISELFPSTMNTGDNSADVWEEEMESQPSAVLDIDPFVNLDAPSFTVDEDGADFFTPESIETEVQVSDESFDLETDLAMSAENGDNLDSFLSDFDPPAQSADLPILDRGSSDSTSVVSVEPELTLEELGTVETLNTVEQGLDTLEQSEDVFTANLDAIAPEADSVDELANLGTLNTVEQGLEILEQSEDVFTANLDAIAPEADSVDELASLGTLSTLEQGLETLEQSEDVFATNLDAIAPEAEETGETTALLSLEADSQGWNSDLDIDAALETMSYDLDGEAEEYVDIDAALETMSYEIDGEESTEETPGASNLSPEEVALPQLDLASSESTPLSPEVTSESQLDIDIELPALDIELPAAGEISDSEDLSYLLSTNPIGNTSPTNLVLELETEVQLPDDFDINPPAVDELANLDLNDFVASRESPVANLDNLLDLDNFIAQGESPSPSIDDLANIDFDNLNVSGGDLPDLPSVPNLDALGDLALDINGVPNLNSDELAELEGMLAAEPSENSSTLDDLDALIGGAAAMGIVGVAAIDNPANLDDLDALIGSNATPATNSNLDDLDALVAPPPAPAATPAPTKTETPNRRSKQRTFEQTMRVSVNNLNNLNNLVGELVVNRNTLEQDQNRMRQFIDKLLSEVQKLNEVGKRMQDLYERSLLENSLIASRQQYKNNPALGNPAANNEEELGQTGSLIEYDPLEMDRFTPIHLLSQKMIELTVRIRESTSDIEFVVDGSSEVTRSLRQITNQLQEDLTKTRMLPFSQTADRLQRGVRDNGLKYGKEVELDVDGRDTPIDKVILESLADPLVHMVNNAIAHGIESPAERVAKGKSPTGKISIRALHQGNQTIISIADDGAGIDTERVKAKAMEKGVITAQQAATMSKAEAYELLFLPSFSTKDQADELAGRGVGMDVVRRSIQEIRGTITTESQLGLGTTFTIRLPLALSIAKALLAVHNKTNIAFPLDGIEDTLEVHPDRVQTNNQGEQCIFWRDTLMPFKPLSELLGFNRPLPRNNFYGTQDDDDDLMSILILRSDANFIAVQVDKAIGEQEIVIKPLQGPVPKPIGIAGATVLGDGRIIPIADVMELIDLAKGTIQRQTSTLWTAPSASIGINEPREPMVLIVDDSITVREMLSLTFKRANYRVEQARDGQEAWDKLRAGLPCDLIFCDIEMPRMDGLELLSRLQKDIALRKVPIAMLTSRGSDRHRQIAAQLGASGYFIKPYLEEALLDAAKRMIQGEVLAIV
jgi:chemosensory pili system protein ChpA (sensor histidine kinase/response regulator)